MSCPGSYESALALTEALVSETHSAAQLQASM
jgi:hypothetical protein